MAGTRSAGTSTAVGTPWQRGPVPPAVAIYLEQGSTRSFACALDWPGWARSGRGDEAAIEALAAYSARGDGLRLPARCELTVVERVRGTGTTDFGAPDVAVPSDAVPLTTAGLVRQVRLLRAAWDTLEEVAASAPAALRKGPRGGGRDRDDVVRHVHEAERSYARKVGVRHPPFRTDGAVGAMRADLAAALLGGAAGGDWPAAYAIRRIAWHVLDHAWEIEDRSC
jgi:hypothetical protein